ncbi:MAG: hypothetical protein ACFCUM_15115 [Bacteroidales bacterium]
MEFLELLLISATLVIIAVAGMAVRLLLVRDGKFSGGSCKSTPAMESQGISCACGDEGSCNRNPDEETNKN